MGGTPNGRTDVKLDAYIRVSRVAGRGGDSFIAPADQRRQIEAYAAAHGHEIVEWWEDLDESGGTLHRPAFEQVRERLRSGEVDGVIAARLDRISRSVADVGRLVRDARNEGWNLIAIDLGVDLHGTNGRLVVNLLASVGEWELDRRAETWDAAQEDAVRRGIHIASRTPTGYRRRPDRRLEPDPAAAPVIAELFRRRAGGEGWTALANFLTESGVVGPYSANRWTPTAVQKLVRNRAYLGEARSGRHVNPNAHEPLVDRVVWEAANVNGHVSPSSGNGGALLAGLARCQGCRYVLKADTMKSRDGSRLALYRCRRHHPGGVCSAPATVMARLLDPYVEEAFLAALGADGPLAEAVASTRDVEEAARRVEDADHELRLFRDEPRILAALGAERFAEGLEIRAKALDEANRALADARRRSSLPFGDLTPGDLQAAWPTLSVEERRALISAALDAVVVRAVRGSGRAVPLEERVLLVWAGEAPDDLPRRGRRVPLAQFPWPDDSPADIRVASGENA